MEHFHLPSLSMRLHQTFWFDEHRVFCNTDHNLLSRVDEVLSISGWRKTLAVTCQSGHQIQYRQNNPITSPLSCCTVPPQELDNHIHHIPSQLSQVYLANCTIIILTIFSFIAMQLRLTPRTHVPITDTRRSTALCRDRGRQVFKQYSHDQKILSQFKLHLSPRTHMYTDMLDNCAL